MYEFHSTWPVQPLQTLQQRLREEVEEEVVVVVVVVEEEEEEEVKEEEVEVEEEATVRARNRYSISPLPPFSQL